MTPSHAVDTVVHDDGSDIDVAPGSMDEMVAADRQRVAVTHRYNQVKLGTTQFNTRRKRQCAAMDGMQCMKIYITRHPGRTADASDHDNLVAAHPHLIDGP